MKYVLLRLVPPAHTMFQRLGRKCTHARPSRPVPSWVSINKTRWTIDNARLKRLQRVLCRRIYQDAPHVQILDIGDGIETQTGGTGNENSTIRVDVMKTGGGNEPSVVFQRNRHEIERGRCPTKRRSRRRPGDAEPLRRMRANDPRITLRTYESSRLRRRRKKSRRKKSPVVYAEKCRQPNQRDVCV